MLEIDNEAIDTLEAAPAEPSAVSAALLERPRLMRLAGCATEQVMLAARHCNAAQMAQVNAANSKLNKLRAHRLDLEAVLRDAGFQEGDEAASPPRRCSSLPPTSFWSTWGGST